MSKYFDKYIIIAPGSDYGRAMWSDLENRPNIIFLEYPIYQSNQLLKLIHHIHFSFGINNRISLPYKSIWKKYYSINQITFDDKCKYCVILPDVSACRIDIKFLEELQERKNVEVVLINVNVVDKKKKLIDLRMHCFSKVFSFDKDDCRKYGYIYYPTIYSVQRLDYNQRVDTDAFFVGSYSVDRYKKLLRLFDLIKKANGKADFHIVGVPKSEKRVDGIIYNVPMTYKEVLQNIQKTNCIVEIMNAGQQGLTLRAMEAICYNKKVLTDNATVKELSYYSKGYIQYKNPITDIDLDYMLDRRKVDYEYKNDFSPIHLIEYIEKEYT